MSPYTRLQREESQGYWNQELQLSLSDLGEGEVVLKTGEAVWATKQPPSGSTTWSSSCCTYVTCVCTGSCAHPRAVASKSAAETAAPACLMWVNPVLSGLAVEPQGPIYCSQGSLLSRASLGRAAQGTWAERPSTYVQINRAYECFGSLWIAIPSRSEYVASREVMLQKLFKSSDFFFNFF